MDANVVLEVLYKRERWEESYELLNRVKEGSVRVFMLSSCYVAAWDRSIGADGELRVNCPEVLRT
ncbi:MAG: hypothetical protein QXM99_08175, partial [Thermofilum sp.]